MHPDVTNSTGFACEALFTTDADGRPVVVPIVKATYDISQSGTVTLAAEQRPVSLTGERTTDAADASYKYEPETALTKPSTDVVLVGSASARQRVREMEVTFRIGSIEKRVRAVGDRRWTKRLTGIGLTPPDPFDRLPLVYERAFGGWDRRDPDPTKHSFEPRNPVGRGYVATRGTLSDDVLAPNLEDPAVPIGSITDKPAPAGFGFVSPDWQPRARYAGTYDAGWMETRMPLLPHDFDPRFYNGASPGLVTTGYLRGDEPIVARGVSPQGDVAFRLPRAPAIHCTVDVMRRSPERLATRLDTVIVNTDEMALFMIWRAERPVVAEPHTLRHLHIATDGIAGRRN